MHMNVKDTPMPQTKAGSDNNAWLKYMKERAKEFKAKQSWHSGLAKEAGEHPGQKPSKPPHKPTRPKADAAKNDQAKAAAQLKEWTERREAHQRKLIHAHMERSRAHAQKAEAASKHRQARQAASK